MNRSLGQLGFLILLTVLGLGAVLFLVETARDAVPRSQPSASESSVRHPVTEPFAEVERRERRMAQTVWEREILAQECGRVFEDLWDSLNAATNGFDAVRSFSPGEIVLGRWEIVEPLAHGIELRKSKGHGRVLSEAEWLEWLARFEKTGWRIAETEFRHHQFETDPSGRPALSRFYFCAHLSCPPRSEQAVVEGDLTVEWAVQESEPDAKPRVKRIDASRLTIKTRRGSPLFQQILAEPIEPPENSELIDPIIVYDLDGNGLAEIVLAARNLVFRRDSDGQYQPEPLCRHPLDLIVAAIIADFDGDGAADFLCERDEGLFLFKGSAEGTFDKPARHVWPADPKVKYPMALTCGDIDTDGDLDLFIAQYKVPYQDGAMPTPYYDSNDGYPAFLLLNDSEGNFSDATTAAGLVEKRRRRSYSASFVDLDADSHLDLAVVSDFAGLDLYRNDGRGRFTDVTSDWIAEPKAFGMSHAFADVNVDGLLDLLMIGMTSPTVDRLDHLQLWRPGPFQDRHMRTRMSAGNRLFIAQPSGRLATNALSQSIARSGWSWGCSLFDFDNDSFPDAYIANGLESRESVRDYESEYWLHDRYVGGSEEDSTAYLYFRAKFDRTRGRGQSYGGYERNRFFLNRNGDTFVEVGHLIGLSLQNDSRNVVAADLDTDGRVDLVVTSFSEWPDSRQTLRIYRNVFPSPGNWIGFKLRSEVGTSPVGARIQLEFDSRRATGQIVTGDSYRSQHPTTLHFGLGASEAVRKAEVHWPNRGVVSLDRPAINRYHTISAPVQPFLQNLGKPNL